MQRTLAPRSNLWAHRAPHARISRLRCLRVRASSANSNGATKDVVIVGQGWAGETVHTEVTQHSHHLLGAVPHAWLAACMLGSNPESAPS